MKWMQKKTTEILFKIVIGPCLLSLDFGTSLAGSKPMALDVSYIPDATFWIPGRKEEAEYHYSGAESRFLIGETISILGIPVYRGYYIVGTWLQNEYMRKSTDPEFAAAEETVLTYGLGFTHILPINVANIGLHLSFSVDVEQAKIDQSGSAARQQIYQIGMGARTGLAYGPRQSDSGMTLKAEYDFKYFALGQDKTETSASMYPAQYQALVLSTGYLWMLP